jgi:hypothetical protein
MTSSRSSVLLPCRQFIRHGLSLELCRIDRDLRRSVSILWIRKCLWIGRCSTDSRELTFSTYALRVLKVEQCQSDQQGHPQTQANPNSKCNLGLRVVQRCRAVVWRNGGRGSGHTRHRSRSRACSACSCRRRSTRGGCGRYGCFYCRNTLHSTFEPILVDIASVAYVESDRVCS